MSFVIIRNKKSDSLTLHAASCPVAIKHYGKSIDVVSMPTRFEAIDSVAFHGGKVKECKCAKVISTKINPSQRKKKIDIFDRIFAMNKTKSASKKTIKKRKRTKNPGGKGRVRAFRVEASIDGKRFIKIDDAATFSDAKRTAMAHAKNNSKETVRVVLA